MQKTMERCPEPAESLYNQFSKTHSTDLICQAAAEGDLESLQKILNHFGEKIFSSIEVTINPLSGKSTNPRQLSRHCLNAAIRNNHFDVVKFFIENNLVNINEISKNTGQTALHWAIYALLQSQYLSKEIGISKQFKKIFTFRTGFRFEIYKYFDCDSNSSFLSSDIDDHQYKLILGIRKKNLEVIVANIHRAVIDVIDHSSFSALYLAVLLNSNYAVAKLLEAGANPNHENYSIGLGYYAIWHNNLPMLKLLHQNGLNINIINNGNSLLREAAGLANTDIVHYLLANNIAVKKERHTIFSNAYLLLNEKNVHEELEYESSQYVRALNKCRDHAEKNDLLSKYEPIAKQFMTKEGCFRFEFLMKYEGYVIERYHLMKKLIAEWSILAEKDEDFIKSKFDTMLKCLENVQNICDVWHGKNNVIQNIIKNYKWIRSQAAIKRLPYQTQKNEILSLFRDYQNQYEQDEQDLEIGLLFDNFEKDNDGNILREKINKLFSDLAPDNLLYAVLYRVKMLIENYPRCAALSVKTNAWLNNTFFHANNKQANAYANALESIWRTKAYQRTI